MNFLFYYQISKRDDSKLWIPYEDIVERAKMMKEQSGEVDPVQEENPKKETEDMTSATAASAQSPPPPADKWVIQVGETIINEYLKKFTLEELMFGPGMCYHGYRKLANYRVKVNAVLCRQICH